MVEELYTTFYGELLHYCQNIDRNAAEDLVQETYIRAMTHLSDLESLNKKQRRAWLYKTARNLYIDRVRRQARESCVEQEQLELASFEEDLSEVMVEQFLHRLPDSEQALFSLRYFAGYNASELGEMFHLPPSTIRARLASARKKILKWYR